MDERRVVGLVVLLGVGCYQQPDVGDLDTEGELTDGGSSGGTDTNITSEVTTDSNSGGDATSANSTTPTGPSSTTTGTSTTDSTSSDGTSGAAASCGDGNAEAGELCFDDPPEVLTTDPDPRDVGVGDLDGDRQLDIVSLNRGDGSGATGSLSVHESDGVGGFSPPQFLPAPSEGFRVLVVDGDGDDDDDIIAAGSGGLTAWTNVDGVFLSAWDSGSGLSLSSLDVSEMVAIEVDGQDGVDLLLSEAYSHELRAGSITNQRWRVDGVPSTLPGSAEGAAGIVAAKFDFDSNGDDDWDAVSLNQYETNGAINLGAGDGTFVVAAPVALCPLGNRYGDAGDLDDDGAVDLVVVCMDGDFVVVMGNGDGSFAEPSVFSLAGAFRPRVVDLNGDSHLDILVSSQSLNRVAVFQGAGRGAFELSEVAFTVGGPVHGFAVADLNEDGAVDVIVPWDDGSGGQISVFRANP